MTLNNIGYGLSSNKGGYAKALETYEQAMAVFESLRAVAGSEAGRAGFIAQYAGLYDRAVESVPSAGPGRRSLPHQRTRPRPRLPRLAGHRLCRALRQRSRRACWRASRKPTPPARPRRTPWPRPAASTRRTPPSSPTWRRNWPRPSRSTRPPSTPSPPAATNWPPWCPAAAACSTWPRSRRLLDDQTTLVSYWVLGDKGTLAFVITRDSFTAVELPDATPANLASAVDNTLSLAQPGTTAPQAPARPVHLAGGAAGRTPADTPGRDRAPPAVAVCALCRAHRRPELLRPATPASVIPSASALPFIQAERRRSRRDGEHARPCLRQPGHRRPQPAIPGPRGV